jgi:hypothetical protein
MKKMSATLRLAGLLLASLSFCKITVAQQPPDNVEGNWTIYSTNIGNGKLEVKHVQIQQYGSRIAGYFEGPKQSGPIQGRIDVHHIMFQTLTRNILTFRGQIYGDQIQGTRFGKKAAPSPASAGGRDNTICSGVRSRPFLRDTALTLTDTGHDQLPG